jgi:hypothetical protein
MSNSAASTCSAELTSSTESRVAELVSIFPPEGSLPCPQEPATRPYPGPTESSPHPYNLLTHLCLGFPSGLFSSGFPTKILYAFLIYPMRAMCLFHRRTNHFCEEYVLRVSDYVISSILLFQVNAYVYGILKWFPSLQSLIKLEHYKEPYRPVFLNLSCTADTFPKIISHILIKYI